MVLVQIYMDVADQSWATAVNAVGVAHVDDVHPLYIGEGLSYAQVGEVLSLREYAGLG